jgi:hypothetical protein
MRFRVLGPLEVEADNGPLVLGGRPADVGDEPVQELAQLGRIGRHENPPRRVLARTGCAIGWS